MIRPERRDNKIKARSYFRGSFVFPLLVPLLAVAFLLYQGEVYDLGGTILAGTFFMFTGLFGGIPYIVFLIGVYRWSRNKTAVQVRRFTLVAPLAFAGVFVLVSWLVLFVAGRWPGAHLWADIAFLASYCIMVGYIYVAFVHVLYWVLRLFKMVGTVRDDSAR